MKKIYLLLLVVCNVRGIYNDLSRLQQALAECYRRSQNSKNLERTFRRACGGIRFLRFPMYCDALWRCLHGYPSR